ncbi:hypothetical protein V8E52_003674 [Russula decolorans]
MSWWWNLPVVPLLQAGWFGHHRPQTGLASCSIPRTQRDHGSLPSWEQYIEMIDTVERTEDGELFIYFKLFAFRLSGTKIKRDTNFTKLTDATWRDALKNQGIPHENWTQRQEVFSG